MANIIKARRKLDELYRQGVEVRFGPGPDGEPVEQIAPGGKGYFLEPDGVTRTPLPDDMVAVWVQAPNPLEREQALRDAQGARARSLVKAKTDKDSEEHLTVMAFLSEMSEETLYEYVLLGQDDERRRDAMREVLSEEEWKDVQDLQDAMRLFDEDPPEEGSERWEELQALLALDKKFGEQVAKRQNELRDAASDVMKMKGRAAAEQDAIKRRAEVAGSQAFIYEYERKMMFYAVRDIDDMRTTFFENAKQLEEQNERIREVLGEALNPYISEVGEAKNSPRAESGSDSSEPPRPPETSDPSIPQELSA